jgi:hypothetical protein
MAGDEPQGERSFKVEDRRRFSETGEARPEAADAGEDAFRRAESERPPEASEQRQADDSHGWAGEQTAEITFASFIVGLSTQALAHLGEIRHPEHGTAQVDLSAAREIIDILGLLQAKTRGNLDEGETALLESALYDLRMIYVQKSRSR